MATVEEVNAMEVMDLVMTMVLNLVLVLVTVEKVVCMEVEHGIVEVACTILATVAAVYDF